MALGLWLVRGVYSIILVFLLPGIFFRLWRRGARLPAYRHRWAERLGCHVLPVLQETLWVHAVSVGEAVSAIQLINCFMTAHPQATVVFTTTTPTGSDRVKAAFKDKLGKNLWHCYFPYDLPWIWRRFLKQIHPKVLVLMETEIWPNLLHACEQHKIPVLIANARLSPRSAQHYGWLGGLMADIMRPVSTIAAQSPLDAERFAAIGVPSTKIHMIGNIKFDLPVDPTVVQAGQDLRHALGTHRRVWIAASTHAGEELIILNVYQALKKTFPHLLLLLVPRHPDRFNQVADLCVSQGVMMVRRSDKLPCSDQTDVFLGDTMGEMNLFYAASDIAFVGGSFVPVGGHNLLEPAALNLPVLTGPHLFNFLAISALLIQAGGAQVVADQAALTQAMTTLLQDPKRGVSQGTAGRQAVEENRGAMNKLLHLVMELWETKRK